MLPLIRCWKGLFLVAFAALRANGAHQFDWVFPDPPATPASSISIEMRFIEIADERDGELLQLFGMASPQLPIWVLTGPQIRVSTTVLENRPGVKISSAPGLVTKTGRQTEIARSGQKTVSMPGPGRGSKRSEPESFVGILAELSIESC